MTPTPELREEVAAQECARQRESMLRGIDETTEELEAAVNALINAQTPDQA